ncbi:MAG: hypothetical protein U9N14_03570 [Pseudomonadota bacterium]|nr:hypothetical protein [Pseudomonadota bacterium]
MAVETVYSFTADIENAFSDADNDPLSPVSVVCGTNCSAVSLVLDDDMALIGTLNDDDNGNNSGSAYIFQVP